MTYVKNSLSTIALTVLVLVLVPNSDPRAFEVDSDSSPAKPQLETPIPDPLPDGSELLAEDSPAEFDSVVAPSPDVAVAPNPAADPSDPKHEHGPELEQFIAEFMSTSREIAGRPGGEASVQFSGSQDEQRNWVQALVVTHAENPLLKEECKKEALQLSLDSLRVAEGLSGEQAALRTAAAHLKEHQEFVQSHNISYAGYLEEVAECRSFCAPLVASLIKCQVLSVARSVHGIVLFGLDSAGVAPPYEEGVIANMKSYLEESDSRKVVLIGRASKIGDLKYNRRLAAQRTLAVRDSLLAQGVEGTRVETMWFGWEPPQISDWVAQEYGMNDLFGDRGQSKMNQSVMLVVYEPTSSL